MFPKSREKTPDPTGGREDILKQLSLELIPVENCNFSLRIVNWMLSGL